MLRRSERNQDKSVDYRKLHLGLTDENLDMTDSLQIHDEEGLEDVDSAVLEDMLQQEASAVSELEEQLRQQQQQEELRKRKAILDKLENLSMLRQRKALLEKAIAGEASGTSSLWQGRNITPVNTPVQGQAFSASSFKPSAQQQGEYSDILSSILQLRQGNLAPFASLMSNRDLSKEAPLELTARKNLGFDAIKNSNSNCEKGLEATDKK